MSISNILVPNNLDLYCNTITTAAAEADPIIFIFTAPQTVPNATPTAVVYPASLQPLRNISYDTLTGVFTILNSGIYSISFQNSWVGSAAGSTYSWITVNTSVSGLRQMQSLSPFEVSGTVQSGNLTRKFNATETFVVGAFQSSGGNLNLSNNATSPTFLTIIALS